MYIRITERLVTLAERDDDLGSRAREVIELLDISHRLGKHFIFVERPVLFDRIHALKVKADTILLLRSSYSFDAQIVKTFHWHMEFVEEFASRKDESIGTIYISLFDIPKFEVYSETHVIGENLNDIRFFQEILSYYKRIKGFKVETRFYPLLGGGSTTSEVLDHEQKLGQSFVVCFSDSDRYYPGSSIGETARRVQTVFKQGNNVISFAYHFDGVREIENLVPLSLYKQYVNDYAVHQIGVVDRFEKMLLANDKSFHFLDLKEGVSLRSFELAGYPTVFFDWLKPINNSIQIDVERDKASIEGMDPAPSKDQKKEYQKNHSYVPGFGSRILDNVLKSYCDDDRFERSLDNATETQKAEYEMIGGTLYNWCCARKKTRV